MGMQIDGYGLQARNDAYSRKTLSGEKPRGKENDEAVSGVSDSKTQKQEKAANGSPQSTASTGNAQQDADIQRQVQELVQIQNKVIVHEQAHMAVGGSLAGGASYSYTNGPDGKRYITGGEVSISIPSAKEPEEQIRLMARVRAAALAPADPSPQDRSVAASASAREGQAAMELARKRAETAYGGESKDKSTTRDNSSKAKEKPDRTTPGTKLDMSI